MRKHHLSCLFFFLLFQTSLQAFGLTEINDFAHSPAWLNLLYYEKSGSGFESRVTKPGFFLHAEGKKSPAKELNALLKLIKTTDPKTPLKPAVECLFPARFALVQKHFKLRPPGPCPELDTWFQSYQPSGLEIVYASQYISNPASVFGHSFLLVPSKTQTKSLWLTYNFAAGIPTETTGLGFIIGGVTGWFKGDYSILPYFQRLFQYGNVENRDLWKYKIKINQDELNFVLKHFWELIHSADFDYYFMDENCAGILLRTLMAVLPEFKATAFSPIYAHPVDVIKFLQQHDRLGEGELIPSHFNTLSAAVKSLTPLQKKTFLKAVRSPEKPVEKMDLLLAESLIYYTSYRTHSNLGKLPEELQDLEKQAYLFRAKNNLPPSPLVFAKEQTHAPHLSHKSMVGQLGYSNVNNQDVIDLNYRFAIHDVLDPEPGFLPNSSIEAMHVGLSFNKDSVWIRHLTLAKLENYRRLESFDPKASWKTQLQFKENLFTPSLEDVFFEWNLGGGGTLEVGPWAFYLMLTSDINWGRQLSQSPIEVGPELGLIGSLNRFKAQLFVRGGEGFFLNDSNPFIETGASARWLLSKNWALMGHSRWERLTVKKREGYRMGVGLRHYF